MKVHKFVTVGIVLVLLAGVVLAGCGTSTASSSHRLASIAGAPAAQDATPVPAEEDSDIEGAKETVVQAPLGVQQAEPAVDAGDWDTEWSRRFGVQLMEVFDSSGDPAWDPAAHPLVYVSSEGPGYSGLISADVTLPGFLMIDAATRETVATAHFDLGQEEYFEPHGLGVSPNGEWIYIPSGAASAWGSPLGGGRLLIVDAKTHKLERILSTQGNPHHIKSFVDTQGRELVMVENFNDSTFYILDPQDDNRVIGGFDAKNLRGSGYLAFAHPSGQYIFVSVRTPFNSEGGVAVVDTETWGVRAWINTHDGSPIYVAFSGDGNTAYASGGHESTVSKIDISHENPRAWHVTGMTSAGTLGPYGVTLNWDDSKLYAIGKGEGAHNRGNTMGLVDPRIMTMPPRPWAPGSRASLYTDCVRGDHALINPDPEANEMWISCNASFNTIIWDMDADVIKENLSTPNGGSTHNGAFVQYEPDFTGQVLSDQNGLHGPALEAKLAILGE